MKSLKTARVVAQLKSLLQRALLENNQELIKQYSQGLVYAKSEHIEALEHDLAMANYTLRSAVQIKKVA